MNSQDALTITVTKDGMIVLEEARVSYDEFAATFPIVVSRKTPTGVFVRGDAGAAYGDVIRVLAVVREAGIQNAGLVVEPAGPR